MHLPIQRDCTIWFVICRVLFQLYSEEIPIWKPQKKSISTNLLIHFLLLSEVGCHMPTHLVWTASLSQQLWCSTFSSWSCSRIIIDIFLAGHVLFIPTHILLTDFELATQSRLFFKISLLQCCKSKFVQNENSTMYILQGMLMTLLNLELQDENFVRTWNF